jgi:nickel/cobalt transporter (NicO) family protein
MRILWRIFYCLAALWYFATASAPAHPLGNFTINHLAKITATQSRLHVRYILDIAEIPTFQIMHQGFTLQQWAQGEVAVVRSGLIVSVDGSPVQLLLLNARAMLRPGAGGLPILRWTAEFQSPLPGVTTHRIAVDDTVYADRRIGWKDVIAGTQTEPTDELRRYPSALIGTPRRVSGIAFTITTAGAITDIRPRVDAQFAQTPATGWFAPGVLSAMFTRAGQTPLFIVLTLLAAFGLGALHALEPGHGKALLAFTLVGSRATAKQAMILGASLTFAHTIGVLLLGFVLFFAAGFVSETIYPWITLASGAAIAIIGARTLKAYVHERAHKHDRAHGHAIAGTQPLRFSSAVVAAMSGGIAPCPAAIVVLLAALRIHQLPYGMLLIVIFSFGLASVLCGVGLGVVRGAAWLAKRSAYERLAPYGPLISAAVISLIGAWMLAQGFAQQGVAAPAFLIAVLTLAAIASYALSPHGHAHADNAEAHA